ncbi:MAG: PfkB family carbohydrate kinase, partial [Klebsiella michiganensis]|nr:PfkB family carbohydrate kinase [Klebsiella michiganensis]
LDLLRPLLPSVDYFMPSLEEAAYLSGETQPEAIARVFFALGVGTCILKDGENGSWLLTRDGAVEHIAPFRVDAVDTTGCGDSYCGGFIAALARGLSVKAACEVASAVAALVATGMGSDAGVVDWQHTQEFMATHRRG